MTSMHAIYYLCIHLSALNIVPETESKEQSIHTLQKKEEKRTNTHKLRHKGERERGVWNGYPPRVYVYPTLIMCVYTHYPLWDSLCTVIACCFNVFMPQFPLEPYLSVGHTHSLYLESMHALTLDMFTLNPGLIIREVANNGTLGLI